MNPIVDRLTRWLAVCALVLLPPTAAAQVFQPFQARYSAVMRGDLVLLANTNLSCATPTPVGTCPSPLNNTLVMVDSKLPEDMADATIVNSSSADLTAAQVPAGAQVARAELYWGGLVTNGGAAGVPDPNSTPVRLAGPGGTYQQVSPQGCHVSPAITIWGNPAHRIYTCRADVTAQVQASGSYRVANIPLMTGLNNRSGGWTLVLAVRNPNSPLRRIVINDGLAVVGTTGVGTARSVSVDIGGFITPLSGPVGAQLGWMGLDGDRGERDGFTFTGQGSPPLELGDACNPVGDVFNSTICNFGVPVSTRSIANGNGSNTLGFDADLVQLPNPGNVNLRNGATSARLTARTTSEGYGISMLAMAVDVHQPAFDASASKMQENLTHPALPAGEALPGDRIRYTVTLSNTGEDNARDVVLRDAIPSGTEYVPGTLQILSGANPGTKTDQAGDDQGELASNTAVFRVGTGANAMQGGIVRCTSCSGTEPADIVVTFVVQVRVDVAAGSVIRNQVQVEFTGVSSGTQFTEASNQTQLRIGQPPRLTLRKIIDGRAAESDQFTLSIAPDGPSATSAGTDGQIEVGPFNASPGTAYTLSESAAGTPTADLSRYAISYHCENVAGAPTVVAGGSGPSITLTPAPGDDISCTFTNRPRGADLAISKAADPDNVYAAGNQVGYRIVVRNTGPDAADGARVRDEPANGLACAVVTCEAASGGAVCPAMDAAAFFGAGLTIDTLPADGSVAFQVTCTVQ